MKLPLILFTMILVSYQVTAQMTGTVKGTSNAPFIYEETAISEGTHFTGKLGVNTIYSNNDIFSFICFIDTHRDPNAPSDFNRGLFSTNPQQILYMSGICYGKVLYTNHPGLRYTLKGGLSVGAISTPTDYQPGGTLFSSNYTFSRTTQFTAGLLINPTIEFPITRHFGFSLGMFSNVTFSGIVLGLEGSLLFGKLRNRKAYSGRH